MNQKKFAAQIRLATLRGLHKLGAGHIGGSMSMADLMSVLYGGVMNVNPENPRWEDRDWLVVSKGHCGPAVYATLALRGFFPMDEIETINQAGTRLPSHCDRNKPPGIDMSTGPRDVHCAWRCMGQPPPWQRQLYLFDPWRWGMRRRPGLGRRIMCPSAGA